MYLLCASGPGKVSGLNLSEVTDSSILLKWNLPEGRADIFKVEVIVDQQYGHVVMYIFLNGILAISKLNNYTHTHIHKYIYDALYILLTFMRWTHLDSIEAKFLFCCLIFRHLLPSNWCFVEMFSCYTTVSVSPCYRIWFNRSVPRNNSITLQQLRVTGLRPGISILFNVTSLIESELCLMGPPVSINGYTGTVNHGWDQSGEISMTWTMPYDLSDLFTAPRPVTDLHLETTNNSLSATWNGTSTAGNQLTFDVVLQLDGKVVEQVNELNVTQKVFERLKSAANYTVVVYSRNKRQRGPAVKCSIFTCKSFHLHTYIH